MNCIACKGAVGMDTLLVCASCKGSYHYECLNIPLEHYKMKLQGINNTWRCPSCTNVTQRNRGENTPVRKHYEQSPPAPGADMSIMSICDESLSATTVENDFSRIDDLVLQTHNTSNTMEYSMRNVMETLSSMLDSKLANVKQDLVMIDSKLTTTKQEIFKEMKNEFGRVIDKIKEEFSETTDFLSDQLKSFKVEIRTIDKKMKELESENHRLNAELNTIRMSQKCQPGTSEIQSQIEQMQIEINERDQALLLNDVEITGVPEHPGESTSHILQAVSMKLGVTLVDRDVVSVGRVGPVRAPVTAGAERLRPRPLVVRLARRALRDDILRNARTRRGLDSGNIGLPAHSPQPVYINERLTKANRRIFWKTRQAGNAMNWKYVWTKEGRIYAKRTDSTETKAVYIKSEKDILRVFGVDPNVSIRK